MNQKIFTPRFIFIFTSVFIAAGSRLLPHPPNFTPIAAMALFCAANCSNRFLAFIIPLTAMFLSDIIIGFHNTLIPVYLSFIFIVFLGFNTIRKNLKITSLLGTSIASSILFFAITNFAVWINGILYAKNFSGLTECYLLAIPFLKNTLFGDIFFSAVLFGSFYLAQIKFPKLAKADK